MVTFTIFTQPLPLVKNFASETLHLLPRQERASDVGDGDVSKNPHDRMMNPCKNGHICNLY